MLRRLSGGGLIISSYSVRMSALNSRQNSRPNKPAWRGCKELNVQHSRQLASLL